MKQSELAIYAAKHRYIWGRDAARQFCEKNGVNIRLYVLACQLDAYARS